MKNRMAATSARNISALMMVVLGFGACASSKSEDEAIVERQSALTYPLPNATGDPQFFGFGYPQLAIMDGTNLQVLASPVRVQDAPWTTRWLSPLAAAPPVIVRPPACRSRKLGARTVSNGTAGERPDAGV